MNPVLITLVASQAEYQALRKIFVRLKAHKASSAINKSRIPRAHRKQLDALIRQRVVKVAEGRYYWDLNRERKPLSHLSTPAVLVVMALVIFAILAEWLFR